MIIKNKVQFLGSLGIQQEVVEILKHTETENENVRGDVSRKLKIENNQIREKDEQLKSRLHRQTKACSMAEENAQTAIDDLNGLQKELEFIRKLLNEATKNCRRKAVDGLNNLLKELEFLRKQLDETHKRLQDETQTRIDLESNIQSLLKESAVKKQEYETILQQSLQELREQHEGKMRKMKMLYEQKIKDLQAEANRESVAASRAIEELDVSHQNIESLYIRISKLESTNAALNGRNCDLEKLLANERRRHASEIAKVDAELQQLQESVVYEKLLYDEEVSSQTEWAVTSREYDIEISKGDPKARVQQKGTNEVQIDGGATVSQRFVTDTAQEPPTKIMMKPRKWKSGENIKTTLYNANEEVAGADRVKRRIIRHVSNHSIINEESSSAEKNPPRRKWIYHVFHRGKKIIHTGC
ncbi:lamin Dm0-like [Musca autumnalis]|uniref:lamin Dm0-like n=1 Tax=Musca autumnalis TaxID=221902 RepID=UPI003CFA6D23